MQSQSGTTKSKAKELNIEHKLTAPLQLENKGVLNKTTQKISEKFMKKTNNFKPKKNKEKKENEVFFDENIAMESIVNELNENFWEIEKNSKKNNRNNYIFRKIEGFVSNFEQKPLDDDVLTLSKFGKMLKTIIFILKKLEEKKTWKSFSSERVKVPKLQKSQAPKSSEVDGESKCKESILDSYSRIIEMSNQNKIKVKKLKIHKYHPASKIIIPETENNNIRNDLLGLQTYIVDYKFLKRKNESSDAYKLGIHISPDLKNTVSFAKFYSGGPDQREEIFNVYKSFIYYYYIYV